MLRSYFERFPNVGVRHRRLQSRRDFLEFGAEVGYLAEPVALWISGHGSPEGLIAGGDTIGAADIQAVLAQAPTVFLVHFSSCAMMAGSLPATIRAGLPEPPAISGFGVEVEWGASAVFEILYLDLVLGQGLTPSAAAAVLQSELNFADETATPGSPLGSLWFNLIP
jgi:hypothetical protein